MTNDDDRWAAAENLAKAICGCSTMEQHRADTNLLLEYAAAAERRGIERAASIAPYTPSPPRRQRGKGDGPR